MMEQPDKPIVRMDASLPRFSEEFDHKVEYNQAAKLIHDLLTWINKNPEEFRQFEELSLSGDTPIGDDFLSQRQIAAVYAMVPRTPDHKIQFGLLHPENKIILGKRSVETSWAPESWAVPMGKVDPEDIKDAEHQSVEQVICTAAERELHEEVIIGPVIQEQPTYLGAFKDTKTGFSIHAIVEPILKPGTQEEVIRITLPDLREHSDLGWVYLKDLPKLDNMSPGMKFLLKKLLDYTAERNNLYGEIYRFQGE